MQILRRAMPAFSLAALSLQAFGSEAIFNNQATFSINVSNPSVTFVADAQSGPYTLIPATVSGGGFNPAPTAGGQFTGPLTGSLEASAESTSPTPGTATQSEGYAFDIDFTNNSSVDRSFTVSESITQYFNIKGYGKVEVFAGISDHVNPVPTLGGIEILNLHPGGSLDVQTDGDASGSFVDANDYVLTESLTDTLHAGQTIQAQLYVSGSTYAAVSSGSGAASGTPAPAAAIPFALGALARRRRPKASL